jgi:rubrerythrin
MSARRGPKQIRSLPELLAHAKAMETEAVERYTELADQMEVHHNREAAALFRRMAEIERMHVEHVGAMCADTPLPNLKAWEFNWDGPEPPEAVDPSEVHYMLSPREAVVLALRHERRGAQFYEKLAEQAKRQDVRELAAKLAEEEREHVGWLEKWLERYPEPESAWYEDLDPPQAQE